MIRFDCLLSFFFFFAFIFDLDGTARYTFFSIVFPIHNYQIFFHLFFLVNLLIIITLILTYYILLSLLTAKIRMASVLGHDLLRRVLSCVHRWIGSYLGASLKCLKKQAKQMYRQGGVFKCFCLFVFLFFCIRFDCFFFLFRSKSKALCTSNVVCHSQN